MIKNLRPCPFCGNEVEIAELRFDRIGAEYIRTECRCGASVEFYSDDRISNWRGEQYQTGLTAIEKWNKRAGEADENEHRQHNQKNQRATRMDAKGTRKESRRQP